jgi:nitrite reductase (NADH) large subunit
MRRRLVVIGNGMAGARTVEEILERGGADQFDITVFGDEPHGNYNRILLSGVLAGETDEAGIVLNSPDWYAENGITLHSGPLARVDRIDRYGKRVRTAGGTSIGYDVLVIATGSRPHVPDIPGAHQPRRGFHQGVFGFRTIDDTRRMVRYARDHERAVVIGGGLLGLEAARGLQSHTMAVTVLHGAGHLMNQQLDPQAGEILRACIERLGIAVLTGARTVEILGRDAVTGARLADGRTVDADMVVLTAGVRANAELALTSGFAVERAIVVDDQLRTDDPDVYAVGECAQHRGQVYGLVAPLWEQARVLADVLTGADPAAAYHGSRTATKLKVAGVAVASMGMKAPERDDDEFVLFAEPGRGVYKSVIVRDGRLVGATLLGDVSKVAFLMQAFDRGMPLPAERAGLLFDLGAPGPAASAAELDEQAQVCNCNGVSKADLVRTVHSGVKSVGAVMDRTRAGKGCGSCKPLVTQIVEWAAGDQIETDPAAGWYVPGIPLGKPALMAAIRERHLTSVSAVFAALAPGGAEDVRSKMGLTSLLRMMWGPDEFVDERDGRFINDRVHANIQKDGTFSVVPQMKGGCTTPDQLRRIADVAEKYGVPLVKLTGGQRIDLLGVRKEDLPKVWAELDMPSGYAYGKSFRTVKTCVGAEFCRFGLGDSTALGIAIESRFQGLESPGKLKLAVTGCPRNCAEAYVKDLGVVAVEGGRWEIYVGGAAGAHVRKGDLLTTVDTPGEVITATGRFLQYYRENANWLERTYAFVPRVGIERLRQLLVEDADGIAVGLDQRIDDAVGAYRDPWQERDDPSPGQFRPALPLIPLPKVPVRASTVDVQP